MKRQKWESEAALCAAFAAWAAMPAQGWTVYPETAGWDMLLVAADGRQVGVEAKLSLNMKVLSQVLAGSDSYYGVDVGPDHRAILVPEVPEFAEHVLARAGLDWFVPGYFNSPHRGDESGTWTFAGSGDRGWNRELGLFDWNPTRREKLPEYVPDVAAGVPSPRILSPWKIGALKVLACLEVHGFVTRQCVRARKNDPRRWCASDGYLAPLGEGRWGRCDRTPTFGEQHPAIYAEILAKERELIHGQAPP